jgi:LPS export ABC transporter protein LptC
LTKLWLQTLAVVGLLVIAGMLFFRRGEEPRLSDWFDAPELTAEGLPQLLQRIRDFRRVVTRKGEKILEISATEASYFRDRSAVEIREPHLVFYHEGKEVGSIAADKGWVVVDGAELTSADLEGSVRLKLTKFSIFSESMRYDRLEKQIVARGQTEIFAPELELKGKDLLFDLRTQQLTVQSGVAMKLKRPTGAAVP